MKETTRGTHTAGLQEARWRLRRSGRSHVLAKLAEPFTSNPNQPHAVEGFNRKRGCRCFRSGSRRMVETQPAVTCDLAHEDRRDDVGETIFEKGRSQGRGLSARWRLIDRAHDSTITKQAEV